MADPNQLTVIDNETGVPVDIDADQAEAGFRDGRYGLPDGARVPVRLRDGRIGTVDASEAPDIIANGGGFAPAEEHERRMAREHDSPLRAGVEGAARGLTFGISDPLIGVGARIVGRATGDEGLEARTMEGLGERRDRNPTAAMGGEIVGAIAPALLTGGESAGASLLARGARAAAAPGRALFGASQAAERIAARAVLGGAEEAAVGLGQRLASRAAGRAASGAVEGAAFGAQQEITEATLTDHELTAESLLASMGTGALWGAGGNVGLGAAGDAAGVAVRATGRGARRLGSRARDTFETLYQRQTGNTLRPGVAEIVTDGYAAAAGTMVGREHQAFVRTATSLTPQGRAARDIIRRSDEVIETATREGRTILDNLEGDARLLQNEAIGVFKADDILPAARGMNGAAAIAKADEVLSFIGAQADEMIADAAAWGERANVKHARGLVDSMKRRINEIATEGGEDVAGRVFLELDGMKRQIGKMAKPGRYVVGSSDSSAVARIRDDWYQGLRSHLEDANVYGKAAAIQTNVNEAWTNYLSNASVYRNEFLTKIGTEGFNPVFTHDPAKLQRYIKGIGDATNDLATETLQKHSRTQRELLDVIADNMEISPQAQSALKRARENAVGLDKYLQRVDNDVAIINQWRALRGAAGEAQGSGLVGAVGLTALGGPIGMAAGGALQAATRPDQVIRTLTAIERIRAGFGEEVQKRIKGFLAQAQEAGGRAAVSVRNTGRAISRKAVPAYSVREYESKVRDVLEFTSDPHKANDRVAEASREVHGVAPNVAGIMAMRATNAAGFLASKVPGQSGLNPYSLTPHLDAKRVSDAEMQRFIRYVRAVEDPNTVLDDIEGGRLSREAVEALKIVYPSLYGQVQRNVSEALSSTKRPLRYEARLQLGILLGIPTDASLEPRRFGTLQASYSQQQPQGAATGEPPRNAPTKAPELSGALQTDMQRIAAR